MSPGKVVRKGLATAVAVVSATVLSGCIGAMDRADFDAEMARRGGGLTTELVGDVLAALRVHYRVSEDTDVGLTSLTLQAEGALVGVEAQAPDDPRVLDSYTFEDGELSAPTPVRVSAMDDVEARVFRPGDVPALGGIEDIVDTAVREAGIEDGLVSRIAVQRSAGDVVVVAAVESPRTLATVLFDAEGGFDEVVPQ
ncbi:hypothetical protein ACFO4E_03525 [Nocardiopsis mangrovi]|uniref:Lipoprotein LprG n=1 Tax=Nocardiopsis mangrovi TaxID=1179818 RepID=A0ABV9DSI4_9ACTN